MDHLHLGALTGNVSTPRGVMEFMTAQIVVMKLPAQVSRKCFKIYSV